MQCWSSLEIDAIRGVTARNCSDIHKRVPRRSPSDSAPVLGLLGGRRSQGATGKRIPSPALSSIALPNLPTQTLNLLRVFCSEFAWK